MNTNCDHGLVECGDCPACLWRAWAGVQPNKQQNLLWSERFLRACAQAVPKNLRAALCEKAETGGNYDVLKFVISVKRPDGTFIL